ncbi:hypothetical protein ZHAS_00020659 [Anopheles sinensis]|uniref:Uncharacterized protein n=1 Tax=Anopheles sinensis TaxID=74873 RepID=A0A084WQC6_ANOSI|nr:hypothetical protein ZHAS_00020659 [Anopheles sinensis]
MKRISLDNQGMKTFRQVRCVSQVHEGFVNVLMTPSPTVRSAYSRPLPSSQATFSQAQAAQEWKTCRGKIGFLLAFVP